MFVIRAAGPATRRYRSDSQQRVCNRYLPQVVDQRRAFSRGRWKRELLVAEDESGLYCRMRLVSSKDSIGYFACCRRPKGQARPRRVVSMPPKITSQSCLPEIRIDVLACARLLPFLSPSRYVETAHVPLLGAFTKPGFDATGCHVQTL